MPFSFVTTWAMTRTSSVLPRRLLKEVAMPVYEEDLAPYVEGAGRASDRNRFVMIVIVIASTLAFGTYWNSRQSSWINSRIGTRQALLRWWACFDTTTGKLKGAVSSGCNLHTNDTVVVRQAELFDS